MTLNEDDLEPARLVQREPEAQRARESEARLLEALRLARLWAMASGYDGNDAGLHRPDWLDMAEAAIAKAEGDS